MSGSLAAVIVIPIVILAVIAAWVIAVLRAASRRPPEHGPGSEPAQPVTGGIFRGDPRQQMPDPQARAASNPAAGPRPGGGSRRDDR